MLSPSLDEQTLLPGLSSINDGDSSAELTLPVFDDLYY
jgi:hypothetical protein